MSKLEERIMFLENKTEFNDLGFPVSIDSIAYSCWANVLNMSNTEIYKNYTENQKIFVSFRVRRCNFTKNLVYQTTKYKLKYNGIDFNIITAIPTLDKKYVDIKAEVVLN